MGVKCLNSKCPKSGLCRTFSKMEDTLTQNFHETFLYLKLDAQGKCGSYKERFGQ